MEKLPDKIYEIVLNNFLSQYKIKSLANYEWIFQIYVNNIISMIDSTSENYNEEFAEDLKKEKYEILSEKYINKKYWKKYKDLEDKRKEINTKLEPNSNIPCKKCGLKTIFNDRKQTRGADEPMTEFYNCLNCGFMWRL